MRRTTALLFLCCIPVTRAADKPFVDSTEAELRTAVPELAQAALNPDQALLTPVLRAAARELTDMLAAFVDVSAAEDVHEAWFRAPALYQADRRETFRYLMRAAPGTAPLPVDESRTEGKPEADSGFPLAGGFMGLLNHLLPRYRNQSRFRYLGRQSLVGGDCYLLAFAQIPESASLSTQFVLGGKERKAFLQGLVWIDANTKRIRRVRTDLLPPVEQIERITTDVWFAPVGFESAGTVLWLPAQATVDASFSGKQCHNVHRYFDYRLAESDPSEKDASSGVVSGVPLLAEDAVEAEIRGLLLLRDKKYQEAVAAFHDSIALNPNEAGAHFGLGMARQQSGEAAGASAEFRIAARLDPKNFGAGPADEAVRSAPPTIRVNVRQVLVPVVITDKQGHYVAGLRKEDFQVFEDGVEQDVTAFNVESVAAAPVEESPATRAATPETARGEAKPVLIRRTYVICVDVLHTDFGHFVWARKALEKFFGQERTGDSQYALIVLGRSAEVIQDFTPDPAVILRAIENPKFQKAIIGSNTGMQQTYLNSFRRDLDEVRRACDVGDPTCLPGKRRVESEASAVAEHDRVQTLAFLQQFRGVVEQLAMGKERRALVLISDGFPLVAGLEAYSLLTVYFPEIPFVNLRANERMQEGFEPIVRIAAKSDVPIYTIDSRGLYTPPFFSASNPGVASRVVSEVSAVMNRVAQESGGTLAEFAAATGGLSYQNSNDLFQGIRRAVADGRDYYLLAYVPKNAAADGKFRKIAVEVRGKKVVVQAKRGYWATAN